MSGDFELPAGWQWTQLFALAGKAQYGWTTKAAGRGTVRFLRTTDISSGRVDWDTVPWCQQPPKDVSKYELHPGDVVVSRAGSVGFSYLVDETCPRSTVFASYLMRLRPDPSRIQPQLLLHYMRSPNYWREVNRQSVGVGIDNLNASKLGAFPIPVPPGALQGRLTRLLEAAESGTTSARQHLQVARRAIERFRQAVLAAACSGRLTTDWREANSQHQVELSPPLSAQAKKNASGASNTSEFVDLPESWAWWTVESITSEVIDYRGRTPPHILKGPIPHIRTSQIRNGQIDWNADRFVTQDVYDKYMTRGIPQPGDVLFTMEAPMGEVGVIDRDEPFSIAQRILLLRTTDGVDGRFLAIALQGQPVRRATELRATGSGVVGIAYKRLRSVEIPRPPHAEQLAIVERTEQLLSLADALMTRIDAARRRVDRSSQAVLSKAFRGELTTSGIA